MALDGFLRSPPYGLEGIHGINAATLPFAEVVEKRVAAVPRSPAP